MTKAHIGVIGVGTMGSALALNFAEKGHDVALWNLELEAVDRLIASAGDLATRLQRCETLIDMVAALPVPRSIVLMIPAGAPVDQTIAALRPLLSAGDTLLMAAIPIFAIQ
jgi:6-phosphogluconate dehydrogenase